MRVYKIQLDGKDFELAPTFENIAKVEALVGNVYEMAGKISESKLGLTDVVNIYYHMQSNFFGDQSDILNGVLADGLSSHMEQVVGILSEIFKGDKKGKSAKK